MDNQEEKPAEPRVIKNVVFIIVAFILGLAIALWLTL